MPQIYKILTAVLAFTGCGGLVITGQLNPLMLISGIGLIPGYIRFWRDMPNLSRWVIGGLSIATLFLFVIDTLIITGDMFIAVAHLTIVFQAIKSFDLKEPWDHLQVYFMSLLQLIIASELTRSAAFGLIFVIFLIALVTAMVISHFLKEGTVRKIRLRGPVIAISLLTLVITILFFISIPRVIGGLWGKSRTKNIKTAGFSEKVDFGSFGDIKLDPTIVMRVEMPEKAEGQFYWRGMMLDYFDGVSWRNTLKQKVRMPKSGYSFVAMPVSPGSVLTQKIFLEPLDSDVIFGLGTIARIEIESRAMFIDGGGAIFVPEKSPKRMNYTAYSILEEPLISDNTSYHVQFPSGLNKIAGFAREITKGSGTAMNRALKIEKYLKTNYIYSLKTSSPPGGVNPIEDFLFNSRQGYCEHYATSMALMLRAVGIPSRVVTGFFGGERNKYGGYIIVRQSNAHSWVEVAINGRWKRFDPTPPAPLIEVPSMLSLYLDSMRMKWYRYVVNFSSSDQKRLIEYISIPLLKIPDMPEGRVYGVRTLAYALVIIISAVMLVLLLRRFRIYRYEFVTAKYLKFRSSLKRKGANIMISSTPSDVMKEAVRLGMSEGAADFISLYERARFGGRGMNEEEKKRYRAMF